MDPTQMWRQWYETSTRMLPGMPGGAQGNFMDPYGLFRQWMSGLQEMQQRMIGAMPGGASFASNGGSGAPAVQDLWQRWSEATTDSLQKGAEFGQNAMEILPRWMQMLEEAHNNLLAAGRAPTDPLQLATQWYNATSGPFSDFVGDVLEREEFLEPSSRFLQNYASFYKVYKRNSEEYLKNLQLPVRSDITRVAGLIVNLEDKIDRIEEVLEDFEYTSAKPATADSVQALEKRLDRVEGKLDRLLTALENSNGASQANTPANAAANGSAEIKATDAARRKAREMGVDLASVSGTGTDGQVTVDDVRKKGDS